MFEPHIEIRDIPKDGKVSEQTRIEQIGIASFGWKWQHNKQRKELTCDSENQKRDASSKDDPKIK